MGYQFRYIFPYRREIKRMTTHFGFVPPLVGFYLILANMAATFLLIVEVPKIFIIHVVKGT